MERKTHPRGRAYQCIHCMRKGKEEINTKTRMEDHIYKYHVPNDEQPFWCRMCQFRCRSKDSLFLHVRTFARHRNVMKEKGYLASEPFLVCNPKPYILSDEDWKVLDKEESSMFWTKRTGSNKSDLIEKALQMEVPDLYLASKFIQEVEAEDIEGNGDLNEEQLSVDNEIGNGDVNNEQHTDDNVEKVIDSGRYSDVIVVDANTIKRAENVEEKDGKNSEVGPLDLRIVVGLQSSKVGSNKEDVNKSDDKDGEASGGGALDLRIVRSEVERKVVSYVDYKKRMEAAAEQTEPMNLSLKSKVTEKMAETEELELDFEDTEAATREGAGDDRRVNIIVEERNEAEAVVQSEKDVDVGRQEDEVKKGVDSSQKNEVGAETELLDEVSMEEEQENELDIATRVLMKSMEETGSKVRDGECHSERQHGRSEIKDLIRNEEEISVAVRGIETETEGKVEMDTDGDKSVDGATRADIESEGGNKRRIKEREGRSVKRVRQSLKKYRDVSVLSSSSSSDSRSSSPSRNSDSDNSRERFTSILGEMIRKTGSIVGEQVIANAGLITSLQNSVEELRREVKSLREEIKSKNTKREDKDKKEKERDDKRDKEAKEVRKQSIKKKDEKSDKESSISKKHPPKSNADNKQEVRRDRGSDNGQRGSADRKRTIDSSKDRGCDRARQGYQNYRGRNSNRGRGREFLRF